MSAVEGVTDVETNLDENTCTFKIAEGIDLESTLNELADSNDKIEDWSRKE